MTTRLKQLQLAYWTNLNGVLDKKDGPIRGDKKPSPGSYMDYWSHKRGTVKFGLTAMMNTRKNRVEVKLWGPNDTKGFWARLEQEKEDIEKILKFQLRCPPPTKKEAKIATRLYFSNLDLEEDSGWCEQHKRIANRLNEMYKFFAPLVTDWTSKRRGA